MDISRDIDRDLPDVDRATLEMPPIERAETIPASWYVDERFHDFDREAIFAEHWRYVGPVADVSEPGAYVQVEVAGNPIVIVRDKEGTLRAFYNVCRHRGGPLVMDECGHTNVLQCKYHGWTYLLDGSLRGVPKFDRAELFDRKDYGLVPATVDTWQDLVFVTLADDPPPLAEVLDGIVEQIAPMRIDTKQFARRATYDIDCNWKVYVDNYLEGYHVPLVHPELNDMLSYRDYRTETREHYSVQSSPLQEGNESPYEGVGDAAYYYFVFPNVMLNVLPGRLQMNAVYPTAPDRARVIFDYYYDDVESADARGRIEEDVALSDKIQQEDIEICEYVQRGLESDAYDRGRFSVEMEAGVYHFQRRLKNAYRAALKRS